MSNCISYSAIFMSIIASYYPIIHTSYDEEEIHCYFRNDEDEQWIYISNTTATINGQTFDLESRLQNAIEELYSIL